MRNNMKIRKGLMLGAALTAVAMCGAPEAARATPAGLTFYPATDIYGKGNFHFDSDQFFGSGSRTTATAIGLEYGTGPDRDGVLGRSEFGIDYITGGSGFSNNISGSKRVLFNAKTQLFNNDKSATRLVAGVWGVGARGNLSSGNTVFPPNVGYLLASKNFTFGRIHAGVAHSFANKAVITTPGGNDDRTYLQLGYDRVLNKKFQVTVDFYSGKSAASVFAPGIIYYMNEKSDFQLGYIRFNDKSIKPRNQIYLGFDYNFGGETAPPAATPASPVAPATNGGTATNGTKTTE